MAEGTLRYWAAAKAAAGVAEEPFSAATLEEALAAAEVRHGPRLADVLARCSFVVSDRPVGLREHADVALAEGDVVEVLPPFAGGASPALPPARADLAVVVLPVAALLLLLAGWGGRAWVVAVVLAAQLLAATGWLLALDVPGRLGGALIAGVAAVSVDLLLLPSRAGLDRAVGVLGLAFVAGLAHQIGRRSRRRVVESLSATVSATLLALMPASLVLLSATSGGRAVLAMGMLAAAAAVVVARAVRLLPGRLGVVAGLALGVAAGGVVAMLVRPVGLATGHAWAITLATALAAVLADLGLAALTPRPEAEVRHAHQRRLGYAAAAALGPLCVAAPVTYAVSHWLVG